MRTTVKRVLAGAAFVAALAVAHQTHTYGMPWDGPVPQAVGCVQPAGDGPVRYWDGKQWQAGWPQVCHQWSDTRPSNGGVFVQVFGHQIGVEVYGTPGPFITAEG